MIELQDAEPFILKLNFKPVTIQVPKEVKVATEELGEHEILQAIQEFVRSRYNLNYTAKIEVDLRGDGGDRADYAAMVTVRVE